MTRTEKSNHIKNKIIEIARRLFVNQGYQKTTIRQIIEEAEINTARFTIFSATKKIFFFGVPK